MNKNIDTQNVNNNKTKTSAEYKRLIKEGKIHIINYEKENNFKNKNTLYIN